MIGRLLCRLGFHARVRRSAYLGLSGQVVFIDHWCPRCRRNVKRIYRSFSLLSPKTLDRVYDKE